MTKSADTALQRLTSRLHEQALQMATLEATVNVQFQRIANMKSSVAHLPDAGLTAAAKMMARKEQGDPGESS